MERGGNRWGKGEVIDGERRYFWSTNNNYNKLLT